MPWLSARHDYWRSEPARPYSRRNQGRVCLTRRGSTRQRSHAMRLGTTRPWRWDFPFSRHPLLLLLGESGSGTERGSRGPSTRRISVGKSAEQCCLAGRVDHWERAEARALHSARATSAGGRIPPHTHPDERNSTVLAGTISVGFGEVFEETKIVEMPTGAVYVTPAKVPHYIWARETDATYQEADLGPTGTSFVGQ
jgi:hypothetical protein